MSKEMDYDNNDFYELELRKVEALERIANKLEAITDNDMLFVAVEEGIIRDE